MTGPVTFQSSPCLLPLSANIDSDCHPRPHQFCCRLEDDRVNLRLLVISNPTFKAFASRTRVHVFAAPSGYPRQRSKTNFTPTIHPLLLPQMLTGLPTTRLTPLPTSNPFQNYSRNQNRRMKAMVNRIPSDRFTTPYHHRWRTLQSHRGNEWEEAAVEVRMQ